MEWKYKGRKSEVYNMQPNGKNLILYRNIYM